MSKKLTKEIFIEKSRKIHGNKYDYSKVEYVNSKTKVCIICPVHGEFWQKPSSHLAGLGCFKCSNDKKRVTFDAFIEVAHKVHGNLYEYDETTFNGSHDKTKITCKTHGDFYQTAHSHMQGQGCPKCWAEKRKYVNRSTTDEFIEKAKLIHGEKYDYSKVDYVRKDKKVTIICPEHGEFQQTPNEHLDGCGCILCGFVSSANKNRLTTSEFITRSKLVHGEKYDYSKVDYFRMDKKVCIICPKHGEFWQTPINHLSGEKCPKCKKTKLESSVMDSLETNGIKYIYQYRNKKVFNKQIVDFYLPEYNVAIECQGIQHFQPVDFPGKGAEWAKNSFEKVKESDENKKNACKANNIKLMYYLTETKFYGSYDNEFHDTNELIRAIKTN